jgi:hypothetical protein
MRPLSSARDIRLVRLLFKLGGQSNVATRHGERVTGRPADYLRVPGPVGEGRHLGVVETVDTFTGIVPPREVNLR